MAVCMIVLAGCSSNTEIAPPVAPTNTSDVQDAAAQDTIDAFASALRSGDLSSSAALGVPAVAAQLRATVTNVSALHLVDLSMRFVEELPPPAPGDLQLPSGSWQATVAVSYRLRDWDTALTQDETTFTFTPGPSGQLISAIGAADGRTPLWLDGPVRPIVAGRTLVLARSGRGARDSRLAQQAIKDVTRVLVGWRGTLVIEAPSTEEEFDRALGATHQQYANIAAVTASVDGSLDAGSPVHVFLNPAVFDPLGKRGAQVVISHESTHVATKATFATMPTWLLEGFADYVALAHARIPVATAAAQILARIRVKGLPTGLPTSTDLSPTAGGLGATYEEAWLACRFIARRFGEAKLIAFYDAIDRGTNLGPAFTGVLGTTNAAFVKQWRADLAALSRGRSG